MKMNKRSPKGKPFNYTSEKHLSPVRHQLTRLNGF